MKRILLPLLFFYVLLVSFGGTRSPLMTIPKGWPKPVYDFKTNPLTQEKIDLGRALFYDPVLSLDSTVSCSSCHSSYTAFAHVDHDLSHGIHDRIGKRNAPALMNLAWQSSFMWDGAVHHLDVQALAPISNHDEMDESIEHVVKKLQRSPLYRRLFYAAYGDSTITGEHTLKAMAQFMLSIVSCESKYDSVMRNQAVFNAQEKNGYALFKKHCSSCHTEPLFTNGQFENNGLAPDTTLNDGGRIKVTKQVSDSLRFKVPTLRNVQFSYPYMHDGRFTKLADVIKHYSSGITNSPTLSPQLQKQITLSSNERVDLLCFLLTLTDKKYLFDAKYSFPKNIFSTSH